MLLKLLLMTSGNYSCALWAMIAVVQLLLEVLVLLMLLLLLMLQLLLVLLLVLLQLVAAMPVEGCGVKLKDTKGC
jgi:hypothetical protein